MANKPDALANITTSVGQHDSPLKSDVAIQVERFVADESERQARAEDMEVVLNFFCKARGCEYDPELGWAGTRRDVGAWSCALCAFSRCSLMATCLMYRDSCALGLLGHAKRGHVQLLLRDDAEICAGRLCSRKHHLPCLSSAHALS